MIYLILSVLSSALISVAMRLSEGKVKSKLCMIATNYVLCFMLSWASGGFGNPLPNKAGLGLVLAMGIFNGVAYMLALVSNQYNITKNGVILSSVFSKIGGLVIPLIMAIALFGEVPTAFQFIGFVLAMAAIFAINYSKGAAKGGLNLALFVLFATEGCAGIMSKVFNELGNGELSSNFLLITFFVAFLCCVGVIMAKKERYGVNELLYGAMIGLPNFLGARFTLMAMESVPAVIVYPFKSVATIVVITLAGTAFFKEKLTKRQLAAMAVILVSLVLLNL